MDGYPLLEPDVNANWECEDCTTLKFSTSGQYSLEFDWAIGNLNWLTASPGCSEHAKLEMAIPMELIAQVRLAYVGVCGVNHSSIKIKAYIQTFHNLASRLLCFSIPTVAIVRGHAVGVGCMFALAHDYRLMSSNHGFIFINEVDIGMSLTPRNSTILSCKLSPATYHEAVLTG
eukprot:Gb_37527 [translate_table: standard]